MCSVVGFMSKGDNGPDLDKIRSFIMMNKNRGHHAYGIAWVDKQGRMQSYKAAGSFADPNNLAILDNAKDARALIAHLRWTTHGSQDDNINNHPHHCGDGFFVHNGVITNYQELIKQHSLLPISECDSEVFGLLSAKLPGSRFKRIESAINLVSPEAAFACLALFARPTRLFVSRRGNPLEIIDRGDGFYFASVIYGTEAKYVEQNTLHEYKWTQQNGGKLVAKTDLVKFAGHTSVCGYTISRHRYTSYASGGAIRGFSSTDDEVNDYIGRRYPAYNNDKGNSGNANGNKKLSKKERRQAKRLVQRGIILSPDDEDVNLSPDDEDNTTNSWQDGWDNGAAHQQRIVQELNETNTGVSYDYCNRCNTISAKFPSGEEMPCECREARRVQAQLAFSL